MSFRNVLGKTCVCVVWSCEEERPVNMSRWCCVFIVLGVRESYASPDMVQRHCWGTVVDLHQVIDSLSEQCQLEFEKSIPEVV